MKNYVHIVFQQALAYMVVIRAIRGPHLSGELKLVQICSSIELWQAVHGLRGYSDFFRVSLVKQA